MNTIHIHLMLNHLPFAACAIGMILFWRSRRSGSPELERAALALFVASGLLAAPVLLSGKWSEHAAKRLPGVARGLVHAHEEAGELAAYAALALAVAGAAALGARAERTPRWAARTLLALAACASLLQLRAAYLGGKIRHPEVGGPPSGAPAGEPALLSSPGAVS